MSEQDAPKKTKSRRRSRTSEFSNHEPLDRKRTTKSLKSRRRSRSELNLSAENDLLQNAAYKKDDIVLSKDTGSTMCVIKTIRSSNGLQYGIVIPPESHIRYIKPAKIVKKLQPESVIARIESITKAYEDANGEMLKLQQQLKMARKQSEIEKDKFKKLKQRLNDQNSASTEIKQDLDILQRQNEKLHRDLEQKQNDYDKIMKENTEENIYQQQLTAANKQIKALNKQITQQRIQINKQRTDLSQQKAAHNRIKMSDETDAKHTVRLQKKLNSKDREIGELKQQIIKLEKKLNKSSVDLNRTQSKQRLRSDINKEQIVLQRQKLDNKLKSLKGKEAELKSLQISKRKHKQQLDDIAKQRQELEKQQKLLQVSAKQKRKQTKRSAKTKVIIHKKYLCKEYMDCCIKWRKRKDLMSKTATQIKTLQDTMKPTLKRLAKLDENKRISKGKNKLEKPNKSDLKEFMDVMDPLDDFEDELGSLLLDAHPHGKELKNMPLQLLEKQEEIDRKQEEIERLQNELQKHKINRKLNGKLGIQIEEEEDDDNEDEHETHTKDGNDHHVHNPYKQQFAGMYRMVAKDLDENKEDILSELRGLITKIGDDIERTYDTNHHSTELIPKTDALCMEYKSLQQKLESKLDKNGNTDAGKRIHRNHRHHHKKKKRHSADSENMYTGTERIFMQKHGDCDDSSHSSDDDSSSIMSEESNPFEDKHSKHSMSQTPKTPKHDNDYYDWSGKQRMSVNLKLDRKQLRQTEEKVDYLTETTKQHMSELRQKQKKYKTMKQQMSATKRDLMQCQGLLEVIEEKEGMEAALENEHIMESKENLSEYNQQIESASAELEHIVTSLQKDDQRTRKLMNELQDLKHKISQQKLETLQQQLADKQISSSLIPIPNVLELEDLRQKIKVLYQKALADADWLESSIECIEKYRKKCDRLHDSVDELSPAIYKFARRPQKKLIEHMLEYNWDLGEIADRLKDRQESLAKFSDKKQEIRMEESNEISNEFTEQATILAEYKKTIRILEEEHHGIMFDSVDHKVTEEGAVYELEKIMNEISHLLQTATQKINDNHLHLNTQRFGCFLCLEQVNNTRDLVIDTVQIPIPTKPNMEDLMDDRMVKPQDVKGIHVELNELKMKSRMQYKHKCVQQLAGCSIYDETAKINMALNRIRAMLASISALHYGVVSDPYLLPKASKVKNELNKLLKNYQHFEPIATDISIDDEVSNYEVQLVQDLAADYHQSNASEDKRFVIKENMKLITDKCNDLDILCKNDLKCVELKHLKQMYLSFMDPDENESQPKPLYDKHTTKKTSTTKADYKTLLAQKYVGLHDKHDTNQLKQMIEQIDAQLFNERARVLPLAFNLIYQDCILFDDAFPGDFRKIKKYKQRQRVAQDDDDDDDDCLLTVHDYNDMQQKERIGLIKELMSLEWKYAGWIYDREDFVTQKMLYQQQSLYYKRLFVIPLNDSYLEQERKNIFYSQYDYHEKINTNNKVIEFEYERKAIEVEHAPRYKTDFKEERKMIEVQHINMKAAKLSTKEAESTAAAHCEEYESSEIDYLYAEKQGKRLKLQNKGNKHENDGVGAHGIGMELEIATSQYPKGCNLEIDDISPDIHCSPCLNRGAAQKLEIDDINDDIHCSPNPLWLKENALVNEYIEKQVELEVRNLQNTKMMNHVHEGSSASTDDDDTDTDTDHDDDDDDDGEEEEELYLLDKLREILRNHQILPVGDDEDEMDLMLDQIETLCRDVEKYHNKYVNHSQKNKKLRDQLEIAENTLDDVMNEDDRLKQEYLQLRQENESLLQTIKAYKDKDRHTTAGGPNDSGTIEEDDGMQESDILYQLKDDLLHLRQDINDSQQSAKSEYRQSKKRIESMCEPLKDLANDFDSKVLKDALSKLSKSLNDIHNLQQQRLYQHGPLANIVESNIDDLDDLLTQNTNVTRGKDAKDAEAEVELQKKKAVSGSVHEMDKLYPELIYLDDDEDENKNEASTRRYTPGQNIEFDANFPSVVRIEIGGNWFNKKAHAVIEWNNEEFKRKMADFKWLWRMLLLNSCVDRVVPDYPNDIPESLWPQGYLRRRKRELNLFLMQCHSLPWIKNYDLYCDIFLETDKKKWKEKRNKFDQRIMDKIKKKEETYIQSKIVNNDDNNNDNDSY